MQFSLRGWLGLPSRIALLLGLGAITTAEAEAVPAAVPNGDAVRVPQQSAKAFGDLLIWSEQGRIFVSEAGQAAEELQVGNDTEADRLRRLLEHEGATAATPHTLRDRIILVGGGGSGAHWQSRRPDAPAQTPATGTIDVSPAKPSVPATGGTADGTAKK